MYYHAHVYWTTPEQKTVALSLRQQLQDLECSLGKVWDQSIGSHPLPMYQVNYCSTNQDKVENLLSSSNLNILLHEDTGDDLRDHTEGARWIGQKLELDLVWLKNYVENNRK